MHVDILLFLGVYMVQKSPILNPTPGRPHHRLQGPLRIYDIAY